MTSTQKKIAAIFISLALIIAVVISWVNFTSSKIVATPSVPSVVENNQDNLPPVPAPQPCRSATDAQGNCLDSK